MTTQRREIGDPLELAATTGKIGKKQTASISEVQTSGSLDVQSSESSNFQTSESPKFQTSQLSNNQKGTSPERLKHRGREQQTLYLPPHLIKKLKLHKALHDKEYSDIVAEALEEYFSRYPDEGNR